MHLISLVALTGLALLGTFAAAWNPVLDEAWIKWKETHNKDYAEGEEHQRRETWEANLRVIEKHNHEASQGKHTYQMGINQFTDLTEEEFKESFKGCVSELPRQYEDNGTFFEESDNLNIPSFLDWRKKGYVTSVKNQNLPFRCGSCWAFSAAGALEALNFRRTGKLVSLSVQNLLDCSQPKEKNGCRGGRAFQAFQYVQKNGGIAYWDDYPYTAKVGRCRYRPSNRVGRCNGFQWIQKYNEVDLQLAVVRYGPVSVSVVASCLRSYGSGILSNTLYSGINLDHAVLVVGYGKDNRGVPYWIIKNSWGTNWGEGGYARVRRGTNQCGIAMDASYPV